MDAELAESVIDDAFEGLGTAGCRYVAPGGAPVTEDLVLIHHRRSQDRLKGGFAFSRGGLESTDRPEAIVVRAREVPQPRKDGLFVMPVAGGEAQFRIGEDPAYDDLAGLSWRCAVVRL